MCVCVCVCQSLSRVQLFLIPWTVAQQAALSMGLSRQEYWSGLPFPSPEDLPIQGSNLGLLHCRQILYHLSQQGSPGKLFSQHFKVPAWEKPRLRSPVPSPTSASSRAQHCLLDAHPHLYSSSNVHRSYSGACFSDEELEFSTLNDTL